MKYKVGEKVRIVSKSVNSPLVKIHWLPDMIGCVNEHRYDGKFLHYYDDFYYAVNIIGKKNRVYHFLECDLECLHENIMKKFNWNEFKI